jgi:hypothetical protein
VVIHFRTEKAVSGKVEFVDANCPTEKWPKPRAQSFFPALMDQTHFSFSITCQHLATKKSNLAFMFRSASVGGRVSSSAYGTIDSKDNPLQKYFMTLSNPSFGQL